MASSIRRKQELIEGTILVTISLVSKDAIDSALIEKFGDILINPSGYFGDPNDPSYPKFLVKAGDPIPFYTQQTIRNLFVNNTLSVVDLQKRADLWADKIVLDIQNEMIRLRSLVDSITLDATILV